ncbi:NAD(P)H-hydrate dehydratase [Frateuria terrea]|uniref:Bifunctional NAD(P)H-hydrate repair enzyme n=1 Tax=Frateuria terrea TaxID=529704 RepID=A0A1H6Y6T1_9GAMM|nr:NAD(P)H-hydrate dehydratase [Frateuria terrea]SEJ37008.1 NAD(P)H-hydrate epimerase [Frateuria terrea]SFP48434.1 NAD(P)H-hydrate epimerase [Frateuria terrea]
MTAPRRHALYTVAQVRALDRRAIDVLGIPAGELMRRAAAAAFASLRRHWPDARRIAVYCGPGNNGGDGYLLALLAHEAGLAAEAWALSDEAVGEDAARARAACEQGGVPVLRWDGTSSLPRVDVHVDALYGTGLNRPPQPVAAALIERINVCGAPVLSLDVPSGLNADTGHCPGAAICARLTVSFIAAKRGLHTGQAAAHAGRIELATLDLPESLWQEQPDAHLLEPATLPPRPRDAHKGRNGHVLAIGGEHGTAGAIRLCGEAALRGGAGLVSVATRHEHLPALNAARPELMAHAVDGPQALEPLLARATVLAVGPGLGQGAWGHALWLTALESPLPLVLDADGLNLLATETRRFDDARQVVLTPHPGEAARLLGCSVDDVERDRFAAVRALAQRFGAVAVLKGTGSLVADPDGRLDVCPWGNPGMASGGMGDLLTGLVAALLAQGCPARDAARLGVGLHARAGDLAAREGERGMVASDLLVPLRLLLNGWEA